MPHQVPPTPPPHTPYLVADPAKCPTRSYLHPPPLHTIVMTSITPHIPYIWNSKWMMCSWQYLPDSVPITLWKQDWPQLSSSCLPNKKICLPLSSIDWNKLWSDHMTMSLHLGDNSNDPLGTHQSSWLPINPLFPNRMIWPCWYVMTYHGLDH